MILTVTGADALVNTIALMLTEAITDSEGAWVDSSGRENGGSSYYMFS